MPQASFPLSIFFKPLHAKLFIQVACGVFLLVGISTASAAGHFLSEGNSIQQIKRSGRKVRVGILLDKPYVFEQTKVMVDTAMTDYVGFSIDVWEELAMNIGLTPQDYEYIKFESQMQIVIALMRKQLDIIINPLPYSGVKLRQFEVTQPYFASSIGLASLRTNDNLIQLYFANLASWEFIKLFSSLVAIVFGLGIIVWLIEKKYNPTDFRDGMKGILDGIWWSTVTITTVGYGDKTPKTLMGRIISILWMFCAISLISSFTATITSTLTVNRLEFDIEKLDELRSGGLRVGSLMHSTSSDYLEQHGIKLYKYNNPVEGLKAVINKEIDVFAYDRAALRYLIIEERLNDEVRLLHATFHRQFFSMLMPKNSRLFNEVNGKLTDMVNQDEWINSLRLYHLLEFE